MWKLKLLVTFLVAITIESSSTDKTCLPDDPTCNVAEDPKCPSRPHIVRCAQAHLDTNKNDMLERVELESAIDSLPWYARGALKVIGSVDKIMEKCDYDKDGAISIDFDMEQTKEICLASCFKKRAFKSSFFPECDL